MLGFLWSVRPDHDSLCICAVFGWSRALHAPPIGFVSLSAIFKTLVASGVAPLCCEASFSGLGVVGLVIGVNMISWKSRTVRCVPVFIYFCQGLDVIAEIPLLFSPSEPLFPTGPF
jgi:hypothetical protein